MGIQVGRADRGEHIANALIGWVMVTLTLMFVLLYSAALIGWLKPLADEKMIMHLEPIIFIIIGYYFGRLPSQQNEKRLRDEITRQTQKADEALYAKEYAQEANEALEERMKNIVGALNAVAPDVPVKELAQYLDKSSAAKEDALHRSVIAALKILAP